MIENIGALESILAYLAYAEETGFREDRGPWDHPYLNALVIAEEIGSKIIEMPIGVWVQDKALIDEDEPTRYIDLSIGKRPFADLQNILREGQNGVPVIYDELVFKPRVKVLTA